MEQWTVGLSQHGVTIFNEKKLFLATTTFRDCTETERDWERARQIVREHNSHEALLTACKYVLAVLKQYDTNSPTIPLHTKYIEETLEAALAEKGE